MWLQAGVVVAAYCGYKGLDNYALYAVSAFGLDEVAAAAFLAKAAWLRPVAALGAGLLADRVRPSITLVGIFLLAAASVAVLAGTAPSPMLRGVLMANVLLSVAAVYALRGVYFTLMEESGVPSSRTGAAVGLVSVVGFTPDIFFAPIAGRLLDAHPGVVGQQQYFALLAGIALVGAVLAAALALRLRPSRLTPPAGGTP
jgi:nitrate/nitrite transporter NarK